MTRRPERPQGSRGPVRARQVSRALTLAFLAATAGACRDDVNVMPEAAPQAIFPNADWYEPAPDATGVYRLRQPELPALRNFLGDAVDWRADFATADGFSPLQPVLIYTDSVCPSLLVPGEEAESVGDDSPVWLIDGNGERIPWFGEAAADPAICELYPLKAYAEGLSTTVHIRTGFAARLADGRSAPFVWSFPVGTFANRIRPAFAMRDRALSWWAERDGLLLDLEAMPPEADGVRHGYRTWKGSFAVPDFTGADGLAETDARGFPKIFGVEAEQFFLTAATSVTEAGGPLPLVQYGHGLFGDPREVLSGGQGELRLRTAGIFGAITWGMSVRYFPRAIDALLDPTQLGVLRDKVLQSLINQVLWARVLEHELAPLLSAELGLPVSDQVDYVGISQGGILGSPLLALSPDIRRAVLHVGGGGWTPMMTHSSNWTSADGFGYGDIVDELLPEPAARTLALAAWQSIWDTWDPAIFAPFWLRAPAGVEHAPRGDRRVYYPYAIDDPQVPNFSSETVARTIDLPLLSPSITDPDGMTRVAYDDAPFAAVASQWDVGGGEAAHSDVRQLPAFATQVATFLRTGVVQDACDGAPCVYAPID